MIRHVWSALCSKASVDRQTNNVSLFELLDSVQFTSKKKLDLPAHVPFTATLVTLWQRKMPAKPVTGESRVRLLAPSGKQIALMSATVDLTNTVRARNLISMDGITVEGDGIHEFEISWRVTKKDKWQVAALLPLEVSLLVSSKGS